MIKRSNKNNELTKVKIGFADIHIERTDPSFKKNNTENVVNCSM